MAESSDGQEIIVEDSLGMVLEEEEAVTLINSPCLESSSIILTDATDTGSIVSHYIIPQDITVAEFEEVVEDKFCSGWGSATIGTLVNDPGIESDSNPDIFLAFVNDTISPVTLLTSVPCGDGGEIFVQKMFEIKEDMIISQDDIIDKQIVKLVIREPNERYFEENDDTIEFKEEVIIEEPYEECQNNIGNDEENVVQISLNHKEKIGNNKIVDKQLMYHCTECNTNFTSHRSFKSHMEDHLVRLQNSCALCNKEFKSKSELQDHIKDHFAKSTTVACEICKKEFISKNVLKRHKKQVHTVNGVITQPSLKCDVCHSVFSSKFSLKSHSATHSTRKPFTCKECGATFTQNGSLQVHLRRHRGEKPFKCSVCGNNFTRAHSLKVHMKTHTGEKPYSCEYCGSCFVTSSHLTVHRRTHTGERPYSCNCCGATFITTSHLNVHRRLHSPNSSKSIPNARTISCSICGTSFDDPGLMRHHKRTEHKGIQKNGSFKTKSKDKLHLTNSQRKKQVNTNGCLSVNVPKCF